MELDASIPAECALVQGDRIMFRGKAELVSPETGGTVATFTESCDTEGSATAKVVLKHAIELKDNERLEIFGTVKDGGDLGRRNGSGRK